MPRPSSQPALSGRAVVKLRDGSVYEGLAVYDGKLLTIEDGRLRVVSLVGGESVVTYRPACSRTVSLRLVEQIVWEADPG